MTNDYYEVFQKRSSHSGRSFKEVVQKEAALDFKRFLISSPDAVEVFVNNDNSNPIRVATILSKEKNDTIVRRFFLADKEQELKIGDFIYWEDTIWILLKKSKDTINAYDKFEGLECRHSIKWIDKYGILQETPCYLVAQTDEKIKANFRTWNNMITPQPNKYLEVVTTRRDIELGKRFLIDETAWYVVESDYISVKGVLYLAMTEDKVDPYQDDIENNIAETVDLNKFKLVVDSNYVELGLNEDYQLNGKIYLNGNLYSEDIIVEILEGEDYISIDGNLTITALEEGTVKLRVSMEENNEISQEIDIKIMATAPENITYSLVGDESIKWGRTKIFQTMKVVNGVSEPVNATFTIEDENEVVKTYEITENTISVTANSDNNVGSFVIKAVADEQELVKEVNVISLWM